MNIEITRDDLVPLEQRQAINELSDAVYPPGVPPDWGVARVEWAPQTVRAMLWEDHRLVCHVGALVRSALIDGRPVQVGGIGGVMTIPSLRQRGYARAALSAMRAHLIDDRQVSFSLLFCANDLRSFYGTLDWRPFADRPLVQQHGVTTEFILNPAMVQDGLDAAPIAGTLDLRGPPW